MLHHSQSLQSALSDSELACIGSDPETLTKALTEASPSSREQRTKLIACLENETWAGIFLAGLVTEPEPLSPGTSECIRAAFDVIDLRAVMNSGMEVNPGAAMAGSMAALSVTVACLNDEEWERAGPLTGLTLQERQEAQCLLQALGGPSQMATAVSLAQQGDLTSMAKAAADCGIDMGPAPGQTHAPPTPTATAATEASTPAPTVALPTSTSTPTPKTVPSTPAPPTATTTLVITVAEIPAGIPEYDRGQWRHWVDADGDCQDARQEVLIAESLEQMTYETDRQCRVESGRWWAPYLEHHLGNPGHIDVDHTVPIKNAHLSGAWAWHPEEKVRYANYREDPDHLIMEGQIPELTHIVTVA